MTEVVMPNPKKVKRQLVISWYWNVFKHENWRFTTKDRGPCLMFGALRHQLVVAVSKIPLSQSWLVPWRKRSGWPV